MTAADFHWRNELVNFENIFEFVDLKFSDLID